MNRLFALVVLCVIASATLVSPAVGGPSIGSVARKALGIAKTADKRAKSAKALARSANANAIAALAKPAEALGDVERVVTVQDAPAHFNVVAAYCPPGRKVVTGGVNVLGGSIWSNRPSEDRTAWIGGGQTYTPDSDPVVPPTIVVTAFCAKTGQAFAARSSRNAVQREIAREKHLYAQHMRK